MVDRALFGNLGDRSFGFRCSRPGYDVKTATPGQLLYDTSAIVFQKVLSGETVISTNRGDKNFSIDGPALALEYSAYSNLHMWANIYQRTIDASTGAVIFAKDLTLDDDGLNVTDFRYGVENGVVKFSVTNCPTTTWALGNRYYVLSSWAVFNALMS